MNENSSYKVYFPLTVGGRFLGDFRTIILEEAPKLHPSSKEISNFISFWVPFSNLITNSFGNIQFANLLI